MYSYKDLIVIISNFCWLDKGEFMNVNIMLKIALHAISLGISILIPWISQYVAIVVGYPITGVLRKITKAKHYRIDISFIQIMNYIFDGLLCVAASYILSRIFEIRYMASVIIVMGVFRIGFNIYKNDLGSANSGEFLEEIINMILFIMGLTFGGMIFLRF